MGIIFDKLEERLKQNGKTFYSLRKDKIVGTATIKKLQDNNGGYIDTRTINNLCQYLNCQPGDIIEYVPDNNHSLSEKIMLREANHMKYFNSEKHLNNFVELMQIRFGELSFSNQYSATLFILADRHLSEYAKHIVNHEGIAFPTDDDWPIHLSPTQVFMLDVARSLFKGSGKVNISDIWHLDDDRFNAVHTAFLVLRQPKLLLEDIQSGV